MPAPNFLRHYPQGKKKSKLPLACALKWRCNFGPDVAGVFHASRLDEWTIQLVTNDDSAPSVAVPPNLAPTLWILLFLRRLIDARRESPWPNDRRLHILLSHVVKEAIHAMDKAGSEAAVNEKCNLYVDLIDIMIPIWFGHPPTPIGVGLLEVHFAKDGCLYRWGSAVPGPAMRPSAGGIAQHLLT
jgi:hypothetical protein